MKKQLKNNKGITLIALVITIIVLLILAGVSIAMLTGENGILTKAQTASDQTKQKGAIEKVKLAVAGSWGTDGKINIEELKNNLNNVEGIDKSTIKDTLPMTVTVDGYDVNIEINGSVNQIIGGQWASGVNSPKITSDMTPIYFDESKNEVETTANDNNWYNYDENKWANAKTKDGSYWVWIPRYEYKILSGEGTNTAGEIDVKFIQTNQVVADEGYKIHPAFQDGRLNNYANGEWDKELSGIWVMKYEASMQTNGVPTTTSDNSVGNVSTSETIKVVSKPGVTSWRYITIGNSYENSLNYDKSKESHMIKNSEWGAIAYLTQSKYGRNCTEISANNNDSFYTGGGANDGYKTNIEQSNTNNIYGIYDLSGGAWERVAAYIANNNESLNKYGNSFANSIESTKYITVYPYDSTNDNNESNYIEYLKSKITRYGDSILETSSSGRDYTGWYKDFSEFPNSKWPFFIRGGNYGAGYGNGMFAYYWTAGEPYNYHGFRICLSF